MCNKKFLAIYHCLRPCFGIQSEIKVCGCNKNKLIWSSAVEVKNMGFVVAFHIK